MSCDSQKQYRYKAIQALVGHLDKKAAESCPLKQGILDTLSQCVSVAADGSLGQPSLSPSSLSLSLSLPYSGYFSGGKIFSLQLRDVSWVNISWFASLPRKPRKYYPSKITRYTVFSLLLHIHTCTSYMYTHSPTHSLTHTLTHTLTHSLTHSLTHPLTRSLTHSLTGPSVLDVFRTLVRHLRISIEDSSSSVQTVHNSAFQVVF